MGRVITIDGPSGAGKSTIAKLLAEKLGFSYLDTGALYRAAALFLLEKGIIPDDEDNVLVEALRGSEIRFIRGRVLLGSRDVSEDIRRPEIGHYTSVFSARKVVRNALIETQRNAALDDNLVAEGRDTGTVVFPDAWKKFYMDASAEERAGRRYRQLRDTGIAVTPETAEKDVFERDARDSGRETAPLKKAEDAIIIDTTGKGIERILEAMLGFIRAES